MLFSSFGSEVPTGPLIERLHERGVVVALPRIEDGELVPVAVRPRRSGTTTTSFGAEEPVGRDAARPRLDRRRSACPAWRSIDAGRGSATAGATTTGSSEACRRSRSALVFGLQVMDGGLPAGRFDLPGRTRS